MSKLSEQYQEMLGIYRRFNRLTEASSILSYDLDVAMPEANLDHRSATMGEIAAAAHETLTSDRMGYLLHRLSDKADALTQSQKEVVEATLEMYEQERCLPSTFVAKLAEVTSTSYGHWLEAKDSGNVDVYLRGLTEVIDLCIERAGYLEWDDVWACSLDDFEPEFESTKIDAALLEVKNHAAQLLDRVKGSSLYGVTSEVKIPMWAGDQEILSRRIAASLGFDFERGSLITSTHPFSTKLGPFDQRLTSNFDSRDALDGLYSTIHETGHGIYAQGHPKELYDTPLAESASFGLDESQSRLYENILGKSKEFTTWLQGIMGLDYGYAAEDESPPDLYRSLNTVRPSLIRIQADELTYNIHIWIRATIERQLLRREIKVADIRDVWNQLYRENLGIDPKIDLEGFLQDPHWSDGSFGYFPTYTLGNIWSAQLYLAARKDIGLIPGPEKEDGSYEGFCNLKNWLNERVHKHASTKTSLEIVEAATGEPFSVQPFLKYLDTKFSELYNL